MKSLQIMITIITILGWLLSATACAPSTPTVPADPTPQTGQMPAVTSTFVLTSTPASTPTPGVFQLEGTHSLCPKYTAFNGEDLDTIASAYLEALGYQVLEPGAACDATVSIRVNGNPVSANYQVNNSSEYRKCFTGAEASAEVAFYTDTTIPLWTSNHQSEIPPNTIVDICPGEGDSPYPEVWKNALVHAMMGLLGDQAVIGALQVPELQETDDLLGIAPYSDILVQGLIGLLDHSDPSTRWHAAIQLSYLRPVPEVAAQAAAQRLTIELDDIVKGHLWGLLQNAGSNSLPALPMIVKVLKTGDLYQQQYAVEVIGAIGPGAQSAAPDLVNALQSPDAWLRMLTARALGEIMAPLDIAFQPLVDLLSDVDSNVIDAAHLSLAQITNHPEMEFSSVADWLAWRVTPPTPTPIVTPFVEEVLTIRTPASFASLWQNWQGKYVVYVHRDPNIISFEDLNALWLYVAVAGAAAKPLDAEELIRDSDQLRLAEGIFMQQILNGDQDLENYLVGSPDYSSDMFSTYFLDRPDFVAFMIPDVARYYHFAENPDLIRIEFSATVAAPLPTSTPQPEEILTLDAPDTFMETWQQWNGKYKVYVHRSANIQQFDDLASRDLYCAVIGLANQYFDENAMVKDYEQLVFNPDLNLIRVTFQGSFGFEGYLAGSTDFRNDGYYRFFGMMPESVGIMIPEVAEYYQFAKNPDLIRVEFK